MAGTNELEGRHRNYVIKQCIVAVFGFIGIVMKFTLAIGKLI